MDGATASEERGVDDRCFIRVTTPTTSECQDLLSVWRCLAVAQCQVVLLLGTAEPFVYGAVLDQVASNFRLLELIQQLRQANHRLEMMEHTDPLTQLSNRRYLIQQFELEFERARRQRSNLSCVVIDIDHFDGINHTYGHLAGDEVLKRVAAVLARRHRSTDHVGRYGGEEFCLVLPRATLVDAKVVAEQLRLEVSGLEFEDDGRNFGVTASFGVAQLGDGDDTILDLVGRADGALYRAKNSGRNRVECALADVVG